MRLALFSLFIVVSSFSRAETPETVYPKIKILRPVEWYSHQANLWKDRAGMAPQDANAWFNYFIAAKYSLKEKTELNVIAQNIEAAIPGTFENHLVQAINSGFAPEGFTHLLKAYTLQPENPMTYSELILMHEYRQDASMRKDISAKLINTGFVSSSLLNYSYNVLMSLEENAILITDSDNTTLPIYLLQDVFNTRKDVVVLNLDMLVEEDYRTSKLPQLGLQLVSYSALSGQELCAMLPDQNSSRIFYYALTLSKENILPIRDQLYVVGLASQLSAQRVDNISAIKNNLENRFLLDYLTVDFNGETEYATGRVLNANYLVPMLLLLEHYRSTKETSKAQELEKQIMEIANKSGKTVLVENFLHRKGPEPIPFIPCKLEAKEVEGKFRLVKDNVYAHEYEVTNAEYNKFLQYLKDNKRDDLYEKAKIQLAQYDEPALSFMTSYHWDRQPTKKDEYFLNYPVINITHEGAMVYCEWLTEQYNNTAERKYKKVKFRLPSLDEWQIAAASIRNAASWNLEENKVEVKVFEPGHDVSKKYEKKVVSMSDPEILYPWFRSWGLRNTPLNSRGCSLGNFKFPESQKPCVYKERRPRSADGFLLMSPVQTYFPNDIGLYDVVGNVAEMINEKGKACGGSWNHTPEQSTIKSVNDYSGPNSETGFRVFMEVVEP